MAGRTAAGQGFATFSNLEMQHSPKIFCIFLQKVLAKNTEDAWFEKNQFMDVADFETELGRQIQTNFVPNMSEQKHVFCKDGCVWDMVLF